MARTEIPVYTISRDAFTPYDFVNGDPTNDMFFSGNAGYTWLEIDNPGSVSVQVGAVLTQNTIDGIPIDDKIMTIAPGSGVHFGPFSHLYNHAGNQVYIDVDPDMLAGTEGTSLHFKAFNI